MDTAKILSELKCAPDVVAAGVLHDVVEYTTVPIEEVRERFGERIAALVGFCTPPPREASTWRERSESAIELLRRTNEIDAFIVSAAGKLANLRDIVRDHGEVGDALWTRFGAPREDVLSYYAALANVIGARLQGTGAVELANEFQWLFGRLSGAVHHGTIVH